MKKFFLLLVAIGVCCSAQAKVVLPRVLGSHMVLQQSAEVELWGKADAGCRVTVEVSWLKSKLKTKADSNGDWSVKVQTPEGSFSKHTITFSDGEELRLEYVMVGDVWVCAGQSNMEMSITGFDSNPVENSLTFITQAGKMANLSVCALCELIAHICRRSGIALADCGRRLRPRVYRTLRPRHTSLPIISRS